MGIIENVKKKICKNTITSTDDMINKFIAFMI